MNRKILKIYFLLLLLIPYSCSKKTPIFGENGMVVSTSKQASQVGVDILKSGGNAIDAAAAVGFALAVTSSSNGNIGGGGFMTAKLANGKSFTLDYREMAPEAANRNMYLDEDGNIIKGKSRSTHFAAGVPGSVDGLLKAWRDYGSGNISAIRQAFKCISVETTIKRSLNELRNNDYSHILLPGVGRFDICMKQLSDKGMKEEIIQ